jgi:hypothetical protein
MVDLTSIEITKTDRDQVRAEKQTILEQEQLLVWHFAAKHELAYSARQNQRMHLWRDHPPWPYGKQVQNTLYLEG